ncbi:MAG TPA: hypothetical protein VGD94_22970 [Vicinamibacterales bacterium]
MVENTAAGSSESHGIVNRVREQANSQLNTQKNKATDRLGSVAHAVRETTQRLRDDNHDTVARYAEQAAEQIERLSQGLKNKDVGELMNDAQRLARRQPALFVGGAFTLGLLGARFLKSSQERNRGYDYSSGRDYASGGGFAEREQSGTRTPTTNAYGNRVPSAATHASGRPRQGTVTENRDRDYPRTEGM